MFEHGNCDSSAWDRYVSDSERGIFQPGIIATKNPSGNICRDKIVLK